MRRGIDIVATAQPKQVGGKPSKPTPKKVFGVSRSTFRSLLIIGFLLVIYIGIMATSSFWVNWWWFDAMGRRSVLLDRYITQTASFVGGAALATIVVGGSLLVAVRRTRPTGTVRLVTHASGKAINILAIAATLLVAMLTGLQSLDNWQTWALLWNSSSFGQIDPYFGMDIGFYIFTLPALAWLQNALLLLVFFGATGAFVVYALRLGLGLDTEAIKRAPQTVKSHVFAMFALGALILAGDRILANYELVYSERGALFGPGYTDMTIQRWGNIAGAAALVLLALVFLASIRRMSIRRIGGLSGILAVVSIAGVILLPTAVQRFIVNPSELNKERQYIENNLDLTRDAYALDTVDGREITGQATLTGQDLIDEPETLQNIRLWDYRIARTTFQQLQSFVPYYAFVDVDVDRYGEPGSTQQVLIAAREIDQNGLPVTSQTWTNTRLVYTHGYAAVVAPVAEVSTQGLPVLSLSGIPPAGDDALAVDRPEIYFGEGDLDWVILNTDYSEFSGISEEDSVRYDGTPDGGIPVSNFFKRLILASYLGDQNVALSGALTGESILVINRQLSERVTALAPFLTFDPDPYLVIADGRLFWIVDAYTTSASYPGATRWNGINYIRNSVKVVVDAYTGEVTFYRTNTVDPIADAWNGIYEGFMRPVSEAPAAIASHFRYPEGLFEVQSDIYASFHVEDPTAFYNGEDLWAIAEEEISGQTGRMEPYYVTMRLPGEEETSFALIRPFIPGGNTTRQNMTAWMAGRVTPDGKLEIVLYRFPRQETVFGPRQVEARINQEPDISAQISLWDQSGSSVLRGNLLVIPIGEALLYVQPLYLQSTEVQGALPELKRVIVASRDRVVMAPTLAEALTLLVAGTGDGMVEPTPEATTDTGTTTAPATATPASGEPPSGTVTELIAQAQTAWERGQTALASGDWTAYGVAQQELKAILDQLEALGAFTPTPPAATPTP